MNRINYRPRPQRNFPLSTEGLDFQQLQIMTAHEAAKLAGGNFLLSGCVTNGTTVTAGTVILNDEILPFVGGTLQSKIRIVESAASITAGSETYENAYIRRHAEFGSNLNDVDTFLWADIKRLPTIKEIVDNFATGGELNEIRNMVMPKGAIIMWNGSVENLPSGWALCNGLTVAGYKTPDLRGRFVVGYDNTKTNIPSNSTDATENYGKAGNTGGRNSVTLTTAQMPQHNHFLGGNMLFGRVHKLDNDDNDDPGYGFHRNDYHVTQYTDVAGGGTAHENRPAYYVLAFIIKYV